MLFNDNRAVTLPGIGGVFFLVQKKDKDELLLRLEELIYTLEKGEPDFTSYLRTTIRMMVSGIPETFFYAPKSTFLRILQRITGKPYHSYG